MSGSALAGSAPASSVVVGASGQRGDRAIDMPFGMVIPGGHLGHVLEEAPLRSQCQVAPHRGLIHNNQLLLLGLRRQQCSRLVPKGRLLLGFSLQVAVAHAAQTKTQCVEDLPHRPPAIFDPKMRIKKVPHQLSGLHTSVIARLPGATADRLFDLRPLIRSQSSRPP